jgi:nucleotide-binding universal stress UspA family protein
MARAPTKEVYLMGTDGSSASEKALAFSIERAVESEARLHIAKVIDPAGIGTPSTAALAEIDLGKQLEQEAAEVVAKAVERAREAGAAAEGHVLQAMGDEDIAAALVRFADDHRVKRIFVGSHGRTGVLAVMLGSTAEKVVKLAHCTVSVVR